LVLLLVLQVIALVPPLCALVWKMPGITNVSAAELVPDSAWPNFLKFFPLFRLPEFLFGMVLGIGFCRAGAAGPLRRFASAIALAGVAGVVVVCACAADDLPYALFHNGLLLIPFAALIFGLAHSNSAFAKLLSGKWLETLGCASYALYIIHIPLIHYAQTLQRRLHLTDIPAGYATLVLLVVFVLLSVVLLRFFEEPARKWIMRRWQVRTLARSQVSR
jgi:peptidoglycan/LPS O-acetylase OafA/YrhL